MITIIHLDRSRSERIIWLMEELGLPYEVQPCNRRHDLFAPDEMRQTHVLGRAPVIHDGDVVLAESGAIVQYILARYGEGRLSVGPAEQNFAQYLYWLHYAEGSLMLQLLREWSLDRMVPHPDTHPGMARIREGTRVHLTMIEDALRDTPHLAGPAFTAADIMMAYPFTTFRRHIRPLDLGDHPHIAAYAARLEARAAFQKAITTPMTGNSSPPLL